MLKVKNKVFDQIFATIALAILFEPNYFAQSDSMAGVDSIYTILKVGVFLAILLAYLLQRKIRRDAIIIVIFIVYMLFNTFIHSGDVALSVKTYGYIVAIVLLFDYMLKKDAPALISATSYVFGIYTYISLATIILYPKGLYKHPLGYSNCWFLGYKNIAVPIMLVGMVCVIYDSYMRKHKLSIYALSVIVMSEIYIFYVWSATGILVSVTMLCIFILARRKKGIDAVLTCKNIVGLNIIIYPLIIFVRIQNVLPFLSNLFLGLGKNLTFSFRTYLWDVFIPLVKEHILFGYGVQNSEYYISVSGYRWAAHLHSYYFQILFEGGLVGTVMFFVILWSVAVAYDSKSVNKYSRIVKYGLMSFLFANQMETYGQISTMFILIMMASKIGTIEEQYKMQENKDKSEEAVLT